MSAEHYRLSCLATARTPALIGCALIMGFVDMVCTGDEPPAKPQPDKRVAEREEDHSAEMGLVVAATPGNGVLVVEVAPHSPADVGGVEPGDFLLSIDDQKISDPQELQKHVQAKKPGTHVEVSLWRRGESLKREITLAARSTDPVEKQAWLGVVLHSSDEPGALIELVHPRGPAKRAGLQRGDVIVQIDGEKVSTVDEAVAKIEKHEPEATVNIVVRREGKVETIKVTLGRASEALNSLPRRLSFPLEWNEEIESLLPNELEKAGDNAQLKDLVHRLQQEMSELRQEMRRRLGEEGEKKRDRKNKANKPDKPEIREPAKPESKESPGAAAATNKTAPGSVAPANDFLAQYRPYYYAGRPYRYGYPPPRPYRYSYYYYRGVPYYYSYPPPYPDAYPYAGPPYYGPGVTVRVGPGVYYRSWR